MINIFFKKKKKKKIKNKKVMPKFSLKIFLNIILYSFIIFIIFNTLNNFFIVKIKELILFK